jgi:chemotaxis protein MotB
MKSVQGTWKMWLLVLIVGGLGGYGIYHLRTELAAIKDDMSAADARATKKQAELVAMKDARVELEARVGELEKSSAELVALKEAAEKAALEKEAAGKQLAALSGTVAAALDRELAAQDARLEIRGDEIVVILAGKALFDTAEPIVSQKGGELIARVGSVLVNIPDRRFEICGHVESAALPSSWELSALEAAAVARLLIAAKVKEPSITICGAAATKPLAAGNNAKARAKNRRVEVAIQPRPAL